MLIAGVHLVCHVHVETLVISYPYKFKYVILMNISCAWTCPCPCPCHIRTCVKLSTKSASLAVAFIAKLAMATVSCHNPSVLTPECNGNTVFQSLYRRGGGRLARHAPPAGLQTESTAQTQGRLQSPELNEVSLPVRSCQQSLGPSLWPS